MKCWKCGQECADGAKFCPDCGADLSAAPQAPAAPVPPEAPVPPAPPQAPVPPTPPAAPAAPAGTGGDASLVLKIFAGVCAAVYAVLAVMQVPGLFRSIGAIFTNLFGRGNLAANLLLGLVTLLGAVVNVLVIAGYVWMAAVMVLLILKRNEENADGLLALAIGGAAAVVVVQLARLLVNLLFGIVLQVVYRGHGVVILGNQLGAHIGSILLHLLGSAVAAGGAYLIIRFVMGETPLAGKDFNTLMEEAKEVIRQLTSKAGQAVQQEAAQAASPAPGATPAPSATPAPGAAPVQSAAPAGAVRGAYHLKTNRGLLMYILLNIITCGIYSYFFIHGLARDVNTVCEGDGQRTGGLLKYLLLNFITCGIYSWIWHYGLANRLAANAPRYGLSLQENGTTVLLWMLVGALLCGIGPFVALHIICRNTNTLCNAYNAYNGV